MSKNETPSRRIRRRFSDIVAGSGTERWNEGRDWTQAGDGTDYPEELPTDTYRVLRPTLHDGDLYTTGDAIDLNALDAAPLLVKHHIDKPEAVTLIVRSQPTRLPATPPMPTRVVEGATSDPATGVGAAAVASAGTVTTNVTTTA